jgi:hypothetical protein
VTAPLRVELERTRLSIGDTLCGRVVLDLPASSAAAKLSATLVAFRRTCLLVRRPRMLFYREVSGGSPFQCHALELCWKLELKWAYIDAPHPIAALVSLLDRWRVVARCQLANGHDLVSSVALAIDRWPARIFRPHVIRRG